VNSVKDVNFKISYRSGRDNLIKEFYEPALARACMYKRSVGYFTSSGLSIAAKGISALIENGGEMRLIASPYLDEQDRDALNRAEEDKAEILKKMVVSQIDDLEHHLSRDRLLALSWLCASGKLKVKLAIRLNKRKEWTTGLYHEKEGVILDVGGNYVGFSGSLNETAGGLIDNYEKISVFKSWSDYEGRAAEIDADFDEMWRDETDGLQIIDFTDISAESLKKFTRTAKRKEEVLNEIKSFSPEQSDRFRMPDFPLFKHQEKAIQEWKSNDFCGMFEMATGSGKTITALAAAFDLWQNFLEKRNLIIVIVCPQVHLCVQWADEVERFGLKAIKAYGGWEEWSEKLSESFLYFENNSEKVLPIVTTNKTFSENRLPAYLARKYLKHNVLLIVDEAHNSGAENISKSLPQCVKARIGLSATPERQHDDKGTKFIEDYFGKKVGKYTLEDAIRDERLCRYYYYIHPVYLTSEESEEYVKLTHEISRCSHFSDSDKKNSPLKILTSRRQRIIANAQNKITTLREVISKESDLKNALIYCGDKRWELEDGTATRAINEIIKICTEFELSVRKFTCDESPVERKEILDSMSKGFLNAIVAIRCLDEGVDLPLLETAFILASSTNPRTFIQRRGRVLRIDKTGNKKYAHIHDFIVLPDDLGGYEDENLWAVERNMLKRELRRVNEFSRNSENQYREISKIKPYLEKYNLF